MFEPFFMALASGLAVGFWAMACNQKTLQQRVAMLRAINGPTWKAQIETYRTVSYYQHFWALFFFRDPMKLYK